MVCAGLSNIVSGQNNRGALILVEKSGDVSFSDSQGVNIDGSVFTAGKNVPIDHNIMTGQDGKVVLLLSNGTLMTLTENTKMKVSSFEQVPFDPQGKTLGDLNEEPSSSNIDIDLDIGSLVVKTKKLNKNSSFFEIRSSVGVAGIRGTEFQMATSPTQGVQLMYAESTVSFTPPGGQPVNVSQRWTECFQYRCCHTPTFKSCCCTNNFNNQSISDSGNRKCAFRNCGCCIETESTPEPESELEPNEQPSNEEEQPDSQEEQDVQENEPTPPVKKPWRKR